MECVRQRNEVAIIIGIIAKLSPSFKSLANVRRPQFWGEIEDNLNFVGQMEDDLNFQVNRRQL